MTNIFFVVDLFGLGVTILTCSTLRDSVSPVCGFVLPCIAILDSMSLRQEVRSSLLRFFQIKAIEEVWRG